MKQLLLFDCLKKKLEKKFKLRGCHKYLKRRITWKDDSGIHRGRVTCLGLRKIGGPGLSQAIITHIPENENQIWIGCHRNIADHKILHIK